MIYDLIIIGGAGAGLTAGIYTARKKLNAILLTKQLGGQCLSTGNIENYPGFDNISGRELMDKLVNQLKRYDFPIKEGVEIQSLGKDGDVFLIKSKESEEFRAKTVIIATGKRIRQLNVPGGKEFENKGVAYCSICDAPLFSGKDVAIVGGGNSGLETAIDLLTYATKIYLLTDKEKLSGDEYLQEKVRQTNKVNIIVNAEIKEVKGGNFVEKLIFQDKVSGELKEILVGGVFVNIGWVASTDFLNGFADLNEQKEIIVDHKTMESSQKGLFAAGDCNDGLYKQIITAAGDGAKSALSAYNFLIEKE